MGKAFLLPFGAAGGTLITLKDLGMGMGPQGILTPRQSPLWFPGLGIPVSVINTDTTSDPSPARHNH